MSSDDAGGYVHDPDGGVEAGTATDTDAAFDWRGWTLVGVIVVSFLIVPAIVLIRPPVLPWRVALLVFPLLPAFLLGGTAVWAAVAGGEKSDDERR